MAHTRINGDLIDDASITADKLAFEAGDMTKAEYDANDDGKVDAAAQADHVEWTGVENKPTSFPSDETIVVVDSQRFQNIAPAGDTLKDALDALDAAFGGWLTLSGEIPNAEESGILFELGTEAQVGSAVIEYHAQRGTEFEQGAIRLVPSRSTSDVFVSVGPQFYCFDVGTSQAVDVGLIFDATQSAGSIYLRVKSDDRAMGAIDLEIKYLRFARS